MRTRTKQSFQRHAESIGLRISGDTGAFLSTPNTGSYLITFLLLDETTVKMKWWIGGTEVVEQIELKQFKKLTISHVNYLGYFIESTQVQYNHAKAAMDQIAPQTALAVRYSLDINADE